ncbi:MAG TPA: MFS transporter [Pirellulales bacterium]|jgi:MFS family permease|nr:MFS transporter [Pirellulales bacterium]
MNSLPSPASPRLTPVQWLICIIAAIGFAFDTYVLLIMPLVGPPALAELLHVDPATTDGYNAIVSWTSRITWASAVCGGVFGLLGGYLTDRLGRRRVLTWSILIYAFSSAASAFATSPTMLLVFRCTTFIGVCVEFVAAVAWLAELFPDPKRREAVLGFTQAFGSCGGLLATAAWKGSVAIAGNMPDWASFHHDQSDAWRYGLLSGLIPAVPLILIRPFLPESPAWREKKAAGRLKRPRLGELFQGAFRRTTIVSTVLFACAFGAAFGALQVVPQIVPGLVPSVAVVPKLQAQLQKMDPASTEFKPLKAKIVSLTKERQQIVGNVQLYQELGGLVGRFSLAWLALLIARRVTLLRIFQIPGLIIIPAVFFIAAAGNLGEQSLEALKWGIGLAGFFTIAQFSFWGNYLPRVYPTYLRGTGESFAANVGGRMFGTGAQQVTASLALLLATTAPKLSGPTRLAYAAGTVALLVYCIGLIASFWLPEPSTEELPD